MEKRRSLLLCLIVISIGAGGCDVDKPPEKKSVPLNVQALLGRTEVHITNSDKFDWTAVEIGVYSGSMYSGLFTYRAGSIAKGESRIVELVDFVSPGGDRFNPYAKKPTGVYIKCKTPTGDGFGSGGSD